MEKIPVKSISKECHTRKGFGANCLAASCNDACCRYGADFDKTSYEIVFSHRELIEAAIGVKLEECFDPEWLGEKEYLGGDCTCSRVLSSGYCAFHSPKGRGCVLYELVNEKGLSRRAIPSICRLYPLTWDDGHLMVYDEDGEEFEKGCACSDPALMSPKSLFETQKDEIRDIISFV